MRKNEDNKNIAVIYWSNSENTEIMAEKISNGIDETGQKADLYNVSQFPIERIEDYDKVALGCGTGKTGSGIPEHVCLMKG